MPTSNVIPFTFDGNTTVRVIEQDGEPWFVLADVCAVLGLGNVTETMRSLDDDEKGFSNTDTLGGIQKIAIVSESGLYAIIFKSRKTQAKRFRKWVTAEVIPSIRKTGRYEAPKAIEQDEEPPAIETPDSLKLRKINTAARCFGERAGAQLWHKLGLEWVPAMGAVINQPDMFEETEIVVSVKKKA